MVDVEPAFGDYLARRARALGTWVVVTEDQRRMHPGVGLAFDERPITFAAPVLGPARLRVRAFGPPGGTDLLLPYFGVLRVAVVPPVQGDGTSGGGGGRGR